MNLWKKFPITYLISNRCNIRTLSRTLLISSKSPPFSQELHLNPRCTASIITRGNRQFAGNTSHSFAAASFSVIFGKMMELKQHVKCRNCVYPIARSRGHVIQRLPVPDDKVSWSVPWPEYNPPSFTVEGLSNQPWADPDITDTNFRPVWNAILDNNVKRQSYMGEYVIRDGYPLNPCGRTGLKGRGCLGRWGPNHAADPVVSRWKRGADGEIVIHPATNKPILQFVAVQRKDNGEWAIPGGMVDPGELVTATVKREFCEEALNSLSLSESERGKLLKDLESFFSAGTEIYRGYVDDPRNTDNAWMETVAYSFHDENGDIVAKFPLEAGDDAANVQWMDISSELKLYASHSSFLRKFAQLHNAHF